MVKFTTLLSKIFALIAIALTAVTCKDFDIPQEQSDADLAAKLDAKRVSDAAAVLAKDAAVSAQFN